MLDDVLAAVGNLVERLDPLTSTSFQLGGDTPELLALHVDRARKFIKIRLHIFPFFADLYPKY